MCGFHGTEPTEEILDLIRNHNLGSVILFSRNIETPEQTQQLTYKLQQAAKEAGHIRPLLIAVDQENGVVRRLGTSGTYLPGSMALGATDDEISASEVAAATAKELLALGINWNLAPVMDVNSNPLNPVIGVRSFGENPSMVSRLGRAQITAYQANRVATSIKHIPGHGDTATDSHLGIPVIDKDVKQLESLELIPFLEAIRESHPTSVMVGHISLPKIIQQVKQPASIAREVVTDLLRQKYQYEGVIITDCLEMDAVKESVGSARGAVMALQAGNDISMLSHTYSFQKNAFQLVHEAIEAGQLSEESLRASLDRVSQLKSRFLTWETSLQKQDLGIVGCEAHTKLSEKLYNAVPTIVCDKSNLLPLQLDDEQRILFLGAHVPLTLAIDSEPEPFNSMYDSILRRHKNTEYIIFNENTVLSKNQITEADMVIIGTANANLHPFQSNMVQLISKYTENLIVVAVINPYDLMAFSNHVGTYAVTYEYTPPAHEASIRLIFGEIKNGSKLPVTLFPLNAKNEPITVTVADFKSTEMELEKAYSLWNSVYKENWPLSFEKFNLILARMQNPRHFAVFKDNDDEQQMIGFAATQTIDSQGQLALLVVHPNYRRNGIGSRLHDRCLEAFSQERNTQQIMLGATYPRFFCGVPNDDRMGKEAQEFFQHRGYDMLGVVWDLKGDLSDYTVPGVIRERMKKEGIWIGPITTQEQAQEIIDLQKTDFPCWASTYQHHADLGDYQDLIVAKEGSSEGKLLGSLVLFTTQGSHRSRTDLVWTDESLFGKDSGGLACVGVATEQRGRGIGLGLVAYANQILHERGVRMSYVDWVELTEFYGRTGYQKWRSYQLGAKK
ncbi:glycoside hydrolase superfamily [Mycotypha africana]|uniref:glycoside hydrolase superfamily n=1 Tax=Mycotypha africana TaxID=64632 RepID=UPI0023005CE7|nr:glycoside hydrolase superfamily [Mycotypha africana]KAI8975770.1 glycoside hydrolase superfamily [Mycotypha africana]